MKYKLYIIFSIYIETGNGKKIIMADLNISDKSYIEPQQYGTENQSQESSPAEPVEENIFVDEKINLDDYYHQAKNAVSQNDFEEVTNSIANDILGILNIDQNYKDCKEFDQIMEDLYKNNKENFDTYSIVKDAKLNEDMTSQEILETLARMSCDGLSNDDDIKIIYSGQAIEHNETEPENTQDNDIITTEDEQNTADDNTIEDNKFSDEDIITDQDEGFEADSEDENVVVEKISTYDASKGTEATINMDNYYYKGGSMTMDEAKEKLASDIMNVYSIDKNDSKKEEKLNQALDDIISKNSLEIGNDGKLDAILRIGNDGVNNDIISVTQHPENEKTGEFETIRRYDKTTGEIISDETENEFILYSKDEDGNKITTHYSSKDNADNGCEPDKTVTYDENGEIIKEETKDSVAIFSKEQKCKTGEQHISGYASDGTPILGNRIVREDVTVKTIYKKDGNEIANTPYKTLTYNENGRMISSYEQIDENTTETAKYLENGKYQVTIDKNENGEKTSKTTGYTQNGEVIYTEDKIYTSDGKKIASKTIHDFKTNTITVRNYRDENSEYKEEVYTDYNADGKADEVHIRKQDGTSVYTFENIDHQIDFNEQGKIGDCWDLASLKAFSSTKEGQRQLDNTFTDNKDGTYTMHFKGVNQDITITNEDLASARKTEQYSNGDNTVLLFEVGLNKLLHEMTSNPDSYNSWELSSNARNISNMVYYAQPKNADDILIKGANMSDFTYLLFGKPAEHTYSSLKSSLDNLDFENSASYITFSEKYDWVSDSNNDQKTKTVTDINGNECKLITRHAFAVVGADKQNGTITIVNPHNNSKTYTFYADELDACCNGITFEYYNL